MFQLQSLSAHPNPVGGVELYKSYSVLAPPRSHFRKATCEEYECNGWKHGFVRPLTCLPIWASGSSIS